MATSVRKKYKVEKGGVQARPGSSWAWRAACEGNKVLQSRTRP